MQTAKSVNNQKIAIVGIDACFNTYKSLDAFERAIYEGQIFEPQNNSVLSPTQIKQKLDCIISNALEDAAINSEQKIAVVVANSKQNINGNAKSDFVNTDSVFNALLIARELLSKRQAEAVVVARIERNLDCFIGAVVLKRYVAQQEPKIYATIDALSTSASAAEIEAHKIAYLEVVSDRPLEDLEIGSIAPYLNSKPAYSCAVSSVANEGGIAGSIASLIKTALCIYYRYIPSVPQWNQPANSELWQKSPFYVATSAKPWFLEEGIERRVAAIDIRERNAAIILSEEVRPQRRSNAYLEQTPYYLYPLVAPDEATLLQQLTTLQQRIEEGDIATVARQTFAEYQKGEAHALVIVGKNKAEILKECDRAISGVTKAFATGKDWQTPVGSYFTPNPQGQKGKVAYVYPGAYNAHLEIGKNLFRLFPNLIDDPVIESTCNRVANIEKLLYPRSLKKLSPRELEVKERELMNDALTMLESETGFAGLITTILRDCFQVKPQAAFGYSQGEISMMYAQGVWSDIGRTSDVINTSPLFKTRLAGSKDAVREYWKSDKPQGELWRTYVVMASSDDLAQKLQTENRVYLTQISTPKECVIAGDPQGCERVIESLGCDAFRAPFNHVIHCEPLKSEYDELIKLNYQPLRELPEINFYCAANYGQIELESQKIAHSLSQTLIQQLDFPRLVEQVYRDDYRIFIEVGAGSNCSRWIKTILKSQEHATISLHRRNTDDFTSLIRALAKLVSHRVKVDLSPLYPPSSSKDKSVVVTNKPVDLWVDQAQKNPSISLSASLNNSNLANSTVANVKQNISYELAISEQKPSKNRSDSPNEIPPQVFQSINNSKNNTHNLILWQPISKNLNASNTSKISQAHSTLIEQEKTYLANNQKVFQTQIALLQKAIKE